MLLSRVNFTMCIIDAQLETGDHNPFPAPKLHCDIFPALLLCVLFMPQPFWKSSKLLNKSCLMMSKCHNFITKEVGLLVVMLMLLFLLFPTKEHTAEQISLSLSEWQIVFWIRFLFQNPTKDTSRLLWVIHLTQLDSNSAVTREFVPLLLYTDMQLLASGNLVW